MKHLYISFVFLFASLVSFSQTTTKNYIKSTAYQVPTQNGGTHAISGSDLQDDDKIETITYFDGLGRPIQSIAKQAGGNKQDIITPVVYDDFGRQAISYLPYANAGQAPGTGSLDFYNHNALIQNIESLYANKFPEEVFYDGSINAYSEQLFESSPLNRILKVGAPGKDWKINEYSGTYDRAIQFDWQTNASNEVKLFSVAHPTGDTEQTQLVYDGHFNQNELFKTITMDENHISFTGKNHSVEEFKDKQGRVILKRTYNENQPHDTYYVYDIFGNLTYVLPPEANAGTGLPSNDDLNDLCYQYRYDKRNRLVEKKIPGKGWEYIVYDKLDRPVLTKDANLSGINWLFTKYDAFDRVVYTGLIFAENTRALTQSIVDNETVFNEQRLASPITLDDTSVYYSNDVFSSFNIKKVYTINYYDDYNWDTCETFEADYEFDHLNASLNHSGNVIEKTSGGDAWNAGFKTRGIISGDGFVQWRVTQTNKRVMVGLSKTDSAPTDHFNTIDYAIYTGAGTESRVNIYEEGILRSLPNIYFEEDDEFKVERVGNQILYKKNDVVIHVSQTPSTGNLIGDSSFHDLGTKVEDVFIGYSSLGQAFTPNTKGLPTGSKIRVLRTDHWICNQSYYNQKGQEIYSISENPFLNKKDNVSLQLDFTGKVIQAYSTHADYIFNKKQVPIVTQDLFTYDHTGRMLRQVQTINSQKQELLVKNHYDELGQLQSKHVGGTLNDASNYMNILGGLQVNGNIITKTSAINDWDAGLITAQSISGDGYVQFKPISYNRPFMAGLAYNNSAVHFNSINYAIYIVWDGTVRVYENGVNRGTKTTFSPNDVFIVERRGTTIYYLKNGEPFYTSTVQTTNAPLFGDISVNHEGTQIKDFVLVDLQNQLQAVDYTYNIRGWLKSINNPDYMGNDLFAFKINYNTTDMGASNNPLYNGNISETIWKTANDVNTTNLTRGYAYNYDPLNRIVSANYGTKTSGAFNLTGDYDVWGITYDKNGNIDHLKRKGEGLLIDDLIYNNEGNQLLSVEDVSNNIEGFNDDNTSGDDYDYDANGNMISDANKGISSISYNHLNLPTRVTITGQGSIEYVYDATGVKQSKKVSSLSATPINTQYAGNFIYEFAGVNTPELKFFSTPEGYVEPTLNGFDYIYQYKDHLGNVRLSYKNPNDSFQNIIDSDLTNSYDGWFHAGNVTSELINGTLKVDVDAAWEGVQHQLNNMAVAPGDVLKVKLIFDKGNTDSNVRLYFQELDANGNHLSWNTMNGDLQTGTYEYTYTVVAANKLLLRIDKDNTYTGDLTSFYIDYVSVTSGELEIIEENNYYPFGLKHKGYNTNITSTNIAQNFKFNSREYNQDLGLNVTEMDFRQYDIALGRFSSLDALAELSQNMTPYRFGFNNPIAFNDPSGLWEKLEEGSWHTDDEKDIERFMDMLSFENDLSGGASTAQIDTFIGEEFRGSGGRLSDGSSLLDAQVLTGDSNGKSNDFSPRQVYQISNQIEKTGSHWWNEKSGNFSSAWHTYKYYRERSYHNRGGGFSGISLGAGALSYASNRLNNAQGWYSFRQGKTYGHSFHGNKYTERRGAVVKLSKFLDLTGKALTVYGMGQTYSQWDAGYLTNAGAAYLGGVDAAGMRNPTMAAWSFGTSLGKMTVESGWYYNSVHDAPNW